MDISVLLINLAATLFMTGVIWFVQIVHYPLFGKVGEEGFRDYEAAHSARTSRVVVLPMLVELATSVLLAAHPPKGIASWQPRLGLALTVAIWLSTFLLQVPRHGALGAGYDGTAHRALVRTNWLRTAAWTVRALLMLRMVAELTR